MAHTTAQITQDILLAKDFLSKDDIVAIPTETVYGLAGNTFSEVAITKIFEAKKRPFFDPLISHTSDWKRVKDFTLDFPPQYFPLVEAFPKGALTLLFPKKALVPDLATSGLPHVAVRVPSHQLTLRLLDSLDFPLSAPSANPFGYISPTSAQHVEAQLGHEIPLILDGGACEIGIESTIIGLENNQLVVYRLGGIDLESLEKILKSPIKTQINHSANPKTAGQSDSHYAPRKPLYLLKKHEMDFLEDKKVFIQGVGSFSVHEVGFLGFATKKSFLLEENQFILSANNSLSQATQRLFSGLRYLDSLAVSVIVSELAPDTGLGRAINDRLVRAERK